MLRLLAYRDGHEEGYVEDSTYGEGRVRHFPWKGVRFAVGSMKQSRRRAMPDRESSEHTQVWDKKKLASFKERMAGLFQELLEIVESEYFSDWALEEINARLN